MSLLYRSHAISDSEFIPGVPGVLGEDMGSGNRTPGFESICVTSFRVLRSWRRTHPLKVLPFHLQIAG